MLSEDKSESKSSVSVLVVITLLSPTSLVSLKPHLVLNNVPQPLIDYLKTKPRSMLRYDWAARVGFLYCDWSVS